MEISKNLNSMMQLEKKLQENADEISKLTINKKGESLKEENSPKQTSDDNVNLVDQMVEQIQIPIAYTANAQIISVEDSTTKTAIDIKV